MDLNVDSFLHLYPAQCLAPPSVLSQRALATQISVRVPSFVPVVPSYLSSVLHWLTSTHLEDRTPPSLHPRGSTSHPSLISSFYSVSALSRCRPTLRSHSASALSPCRPTVRQLSHGADTCFELCSLTRCVIRASSLRLSH